MAVEDPPAPKKVEKEQEAVRPVMIPELRKETVMTPISQIGLRSDLKRENVLLTESIEILQRK